MTDDLDALKSALQATPAPDPEARAAALRLAMDNFDRLQGSTDPTRLEDDRPSQAGFLHKVRQMLKTLKPIPTLAATTSALALMIGLFVALPQTQPLPDLNLRDEAAKPAAPQNSLRGDLVMPEAAPTPLPEQDTLAQTLQAAPEPMPAAPMTEKMALGGTVGLAAPNAAKRQPGIAISGAFTMEDALAQSAAQPEPDTEAFANATPNPVHVTAEDPVPPPPPDLLGRCRHRLLCRHPLQPERGPTAPARRRADRRDGELFPLRLHRPHRRRPLCGHRHRDAHPWNPNTRLVHIALQGRQVTERPPLNLVFLIDTSGSMNEPAKLPLLRQSLSLMLGQLTPQDHVAIVAYAGSAGEVLPPTPASDRAAILQALDNLSAGGSTAGAEGLTLAYNVAAKMKAEGSVTRVLLATDGDFNVGIDTPDDLKTFIAQERAGGTYLSVLGFGRGNLDDATMQALAQNGNGTASYIDTLSEAQKVLGDQMTGAMFPIADDVKVQVEWNPTQVAEYRLIGYETRALRREDFNNDRVDAGEIGAGLQVTALYEVTPPGSPALLNDTLRYGQTAETAASPELGFLRLRYKNPGQTTSNLIETPITPAETATPEASFAAAIAGFGQLLQASPYLNGWTYDQAIALATQSKGPDAYGYRSEAITLMRLAQSLSH